VAGTKRRARRRSVLEGRQEEEDRQGAGMKVHIWVQSCEYLEEAGQIRTAFDVLMALRQCDELQAIGPQSQVARSTALCNSAARP